MGTKWCELTECEWNRIKDVLPPEHPKEENRGRLAKYDNCSAMNGILWIARGEHRGETSRNNMAYGKQFTADSESGGIWEYLKRFSSLCPLTQLRVRCIRVQIEEKNLCGFKIE